MFCSSTGLCISSQSFHFKHNIQLALSYVDQDFSRQMIPDRTSLTFSATMFCLAKPITLQSFPENKSILTIMVQPHNDKRHIVYMCINACIVVVYSEISYERESCMGTWTPQSIRGVSKRYWSLFNSRVERGFNKMQLKNHWETMENMA